MYKDGLDLVRTVKSWQVSVCAPRCVCVMVCVCRCEKVRSCEWSFHVWLSCAVRPTVRLCTHTVATPTDVTQRAAAWLLWLDNLKLISNHERWVTSELCKAARLRLSFYLTCGDMLNCNEVWMMFLLENLLRMWPIQGSEYGDECSYSERSILPLLDQWKDFNTLIIQPKV